MPWPSDIPVLLEARRFNLVATASASSGDPSSPATKAGNQAMATLSDRFDKMAQWTAAHAGRASTFCVALAAIVIWGISGPIFEWSDTWQLIINTSTTII